MSYCISADRSNEQGAFYFAQQVTR